MLPKDSDKIFVSRTVTQPRRGVGPRGDPDSDARAESATLSLSLPPLLVGIIICYSRAHKLFSNRISLSEICTTQATCSATVRFGFGRRRRELRATLDTDMTSTSADELREQAIEQLTELGLGLYAARTFVALVVLSEGTAVEVSWAGDVPRTRVYDAAEELAEQGLVEIDDSTPRRFSPVGSDEAAELLLSEYRDRVEALRTALGALEGGRPKR